MINLDGYLKFMPVLKDTPQQNVWLDYDAEADVLYINYHPSAVADDSELTEDDVIIRYQSGEVIGYTVLHVSQR